MPSRQLPEGGGGDPGKASGGLGTVALSRTASRPDAREAGRSRKDPPWEPSGRVWPRLDLDFRLLVSRIGQQKFLLFEVSWCVRS